MSESGSLATLAAALSEALRINGPGVSPTYAAALLMATHSEALKLIEWDLRRSAFWGIGITSFFSRVAPWGWLDYEGGRGVVKISCGKECAPAYVGDWVGLAIY